MNFCACFWIICNYIKGSAQECPADQLMPNPFCPQNSPATPARRLPRPSVLVFALRAALEFAAASWSSHRDGV